MQRRRGSAASSACHHLHELIEVDGARAVAVDLVDDAVKLLVGQLGVQLVEDLLESGCGDVPVALLVVDAEGLAQLLLHPLLVLLHQELGVEEVMKLKKVGKIEELVLVAVALFALEGELLFGLEVPREVLAKH